MELKIIQSISILCLPLKELIITTNQTTQQKKRTEQKIIIKKNHREENVIKFVAKNIKKKQHIISEFDAVTSILKGRIYVYIHTRHHIMSHGSLSGANFVPYKEILFSFFLHFFLIFAA